MTKLKLFFFMTAALFILAACNSADSNAGNLPPEPIAEISTSDESMADDGATMAEDSDEITHEDAAMDENSDEMAHEDAAMDEDSGEMAHEDATMDEDSDEMSDSDETISEENDSMENSDEAMSEESDSMADNGEGTTQAAMDRPAWQQIPLTNAHTGESFTFADFAGKTVFVEPMATWCSNCRHQLGNVKVAKEQLNNDNVVFIGLSVEVGLANNVLADYANDNGFNWTWAVLDQSSLQELAAVFGRTFANAPATPHFIINPDGSFSDLSTGIEAPELLLEQIRAANG